MYLDNCMCKCSETYKKMRRLSLFGIASVGVGAGIYFGIKKMAQLQEDKDCYRRYEEEHPEEDYKSRMEFYEAEFKRQDDEEEEELEKAIEEFNSRRLKRENCPHCGNKQRVRNKRDRRVNRRSTKVNNDEFENYIYLD